MRNTLSRTPWPVLLVFVLVVLPPVLTFNAARRYRVLPQDLAIAFTAVEGIIVVLHVVAVLRGMKRLQIATIVAFITSGLIANVSGLIFLIEMMLNPQGLDGRRLLISAVYVWGSNILLFSLAYWSVDGGGPRRREERTSARDLIFPEMQVDGERLFLPTFADYVYLAFSTSTAFSATDTLTASGRIRALLVVQAAISLATIAIVAARAVNIFPSG